MYLRNWAESAVPVADRGYVTDIMHYCKVEYLLADSPVWSTLTSPGSLKALKKNRRES